MNYAQIWHTLSALDHWFESLRTPHGLGGPVSHWWESSLMYCGAMMDWRYEGLLTGYVALYSRTRDPHWLNRAIAAGEDICRAIMPDATYWNSSFQIGPLPGGTPHEAAVNVGLLELAELLRELDDPRWHVFFAVAERNLGAFHVGRLWSPERQAFRDQPWNEAYIANKNGTILEALLLYERLSGQTMEPYIRGAANLMLSAQVHADTAYRGATIHLGTGKHRLAIGIYTARNVGALLRLNRRYPDQLYLAAALAMGSYLKRLVTAEGTAFGHYPDNRVIRCPTWISPSGDFLRAFLALQPHDPTVTPLMDEIIALLVERQFPSGGIPTAAGLGYKGRTQPPPTLPDFRDVLPVAGWCDKAFRGLAYAVCTSPDDLPSIPEIDPGHETVVLCTWKGTTCRYQETASDLRLETVRNSKTLFHWHKGETYPRVYAL